MPVQTRRGAETPVADMVAMIASPIGRNPSTTQRGNAAKMEWIIMTKVNIGKDLELDVDFTKFNQAVIDHILYVGARNILMDSHAGVTAEKSDNVQAESLAVATKKLEAMYNGEVRTASSRTGDPVKAEAIRIASDKIKAAARKAGKKLADIDAKALREAAVALVSRTPAIMDQARANVEAAKAVEVDLTGISL